MVLLRAWRFTIHASTFIEGPHAGKVFNVAPVVGRIGEDIAGLLRAETQTPRAATVEPRSTAHR